MTHPTRLPRYAANGPVEYADVLLALRWCRERRYVRARYLATRARAMRPVRLPGVSL